MAQFWDALDRDALLRPVRTDGLTERIRDILARTRVQFAERLGSGQAERLARTVVSEVNAYQADEWTRTLRAAGIDFFSDPDLSDILEASIAENVRLIQDLPEKALRDIEGIILRAAQSGQRAEATATQLAEVETISRARAVLIARDQANKLYGAFAKARQEAMGVTRYIWRSSRDERVRPRHRVFNGQLRSWADDSPHPGEEVRCRCTAEAYLDDILDP